MWIFILIIIGLIIGKFTFDSLRQSSAMKQAGGMAIKYSELVDACLGCSGARILRETPTFISIGGKYTKKGITIDYAFWIHHTFNDKLVVKYVLKAPNMPQKVVKQWQFSQSQPQSQMIGTMSVCLNELSINNPSFDDEAIASTDVNTNLMHKEVKLSKNYKTLIQGLHNKVFPYITPTIYNEDKDGFYLSFKGTKGEVVYIVMDSFNKVTIWGRSNLAKAFIYEGEWSYEKPVDQNMIVEDIQTSILQNVASGKS